MDHGGASTHAGRVGCRRQRLHPDEILAWRTEPNSVIQHAGIVRFRPIADGGTTVDVRLSYNPGIGGVGHTFATLFAADPKHQMDDDLMRMKSFIETGRVPSDAAWQNA
jgi:uncharacterized membrane protein